MVRPLPRFTGYLAKHYARQRTRLNGDRELLNQFARFRDGNVTDFSNRRGMKGAATLLVIVLGTIITLLGNPSQTVSAGLLARMRADALERLLPVRSRDREYELEHEHQHQH